MLTATGSNPIEQYEVACRSWIDAQRAVWEAHTQYVVAKATAYNKLIKQPKITHFQAVNYSYTDPAVQDASRFLNQAKYLARLAWLEATVAKLKLSPASPIVEPTEVEASQDSY